MKIEKLFIPVMLLALFIAACGTESKSDSAEQSKSATPPAPQSLAHAVKTETEAVDENGWYHDWDMGIAAAKQAGKPVIVDFYTDWCKWCKVMDEKTFSDPEVKKVLTENWIAIKLNAEDKSTMGTFKGKAMNYNQLTSAFGVRGFPSYLFLDKTGEPVTVIPNYWDKEKFLPILEFFQEEMYVDEVNLMEYVESKQ